jgi:glutamyl-tRNA reductase
VSHAHHSGELLALGISHKTAPVALRERLALTEGETERVVQELAAAAEVHEAVAISTCNRTELYMVVGDPVEAETELLGMLARRAGIRPTELAGVIYSPRNCDAARQLYRVTSGLESMIVGEAEVQGQVSAPTTRRGPRARRAHDQPAVLRRAADGQARAHRDADRLPAHVGLLRGRRARRRGGRATSPSATS